jgi:hypothetical protein
MYAGPMYAGHLSCRHHDDGRMEIIRADPEVSISVGLALALAAAGCLTHHDGLLTLTGSTPDGTPAELAYAVTALTSAEYPTDEGGWINLRRRDQRTADPETECGHTIVDAGGEAQHHDIPDDGAPHAPTSECGCSPQRVLVGGHVVYEHADQDADTEE